MIVCHCTGTTDEAIGRLAREGVVSVREVVRRTGAGRCCAPCREEIADILSRSATEPAPAEVA
jgi:bacterioferritin-associated ferredoxin